MPRTCSSHGKEARSIIISQLLRSSLEQCQENGAATKWFGLFATGMPDLGEPLGPGATRLKGHRVLVASVSSLGSGWACSLPCRGLLAMS